LEAGDVTVVEPNTALRERAASLGVTVLEAPDRDGQADLVVFAVKPQVMRDVVPAYARMVAGGTAFLSVAAGIAVAVFEGLLGKEAAIMRCMPNTPASIGKGMMV